MMQDCILGIKNAKNIYLRFKFPKILSFVTLTLSKFTWEVIVLKNTKTVFFSYEKKETADKKEAYEIMIKIIKNSFINTK